MRRAVTVCGLTALLVLMPRTSRAATTCSFAGIVTMAFGAYDPLLSSPVDSLGSLTVTCTGTAPGDLLRITLSTGIGGSFLPRAMLFGAYRLGYNVYVDSARTVIFGDGSGGSTPITIPAPASPLTLNLFGRIPPNQRVGVGEYQDTLIATILY